MHLISGEFRGERVLLYYEREGSIQVPFLGSCVIVEILHVPIRGTDCLGILGM